MLLSKLNYLLVKEIYGNKMIKIKNKCVLDSLLKL